MSRIVLSILLLSFIASCGFKPVYAKENSGAYYELQNIKIEPVQGRTGQVLTSKLHDLINPENKYSNSNYNLKIELKRERRDLGIQENLRITRYDVILTAKYALVDNATGQNIDSGVARIKSSFNRTESEFSTYVAEQDAEEKAAEELAEEIRTRLMIFFTK